MVMIPVMDCEFLQILAGKLPAAASTDPRIKFECLLPIGQFPLLLITPGLGNDPVQFVIIYLCFLQRCRNQFLVIFIILDE